MSGPSSSKGKDRATDSRLETSTEERGQEAPAEESNEEVEEQATMDQMQELQRVLTAFINKAPQHAGEAQASGAGTKKRKAEQIRLVSGTASGLPKIPKKPNGKTRAEVDHKTERQATMQGDSELNNILASLPDDTITPHEKQQLEVGARIRDLVLVCQSLMEGLASNVEVLLEAAPEHLPKDDINLIDQISTITTRSNQAKNHSNFQTNPRHPVQKPGARPRS